MNAAFHGAVLRDLIAAARPFGEMAQEMLTGHAAGTLPPNAPQRLLAALHRAEATIAAPVCCGLGYSDEKGELLVCADCPDVTAKSAVQRAAFTARDNEGRSR